MGLVMENEIDYKALKILLIFDAPFNTFNGYFKKSPPFKRWALSTFENDFLSPVHFLFPGFHGIRINTHPHADTQVAVCKTGSIGHAG